MQRLLSASLVGAALAACGSGSSEPYIVGQHVCVEAATTVDLGPGSQLPEPGANAGCRTWPNRDEVLPLVQERSMCGPCGFVLDPSMTAQERAEHPTACCYLVSSPPPPPQ